MRTIKGLLIGALALAVCSAPALAADMRYKSPTPAERVAQGYSWQGFYIGIDGGGLNSFDGVSIGGTEPIGTAVVATGAVPGSLKTQPHGWLVGGNVGYNFQTGVFVYGVEGTFSWLNTEGSDGRVLTTVPLGFPATLTTDSTAGWDWLATVEGRFGVAIADRFVLGVKGGGAFADVNSRTTISLSTPFPGIAGTASGETSGMRTGWTLGAFAEYAAWERVRLRAGYSYVDLGSEDYQLAATVAGTPVGFSARQDYKAHLFKAGASIAF